jgi:glycosyltransferase involved in cell wall biosynthesis
MLHFEHKFERKIEVVYNSIAPRNFVKEYGNARKIKLLFVGADALTNAWEAFDYKGGRETLATFSLLRQRYNDLELIVRSNPPPDIRAKYEGMDGVRIIDKFIPWEDLEREYRTADIFLMPSHTTIFMTLLEAMSFELPIVTIDSWSNAEHVEDGKTGLVAPKSTRLMHTYRGTHQTEMATPEFWRAIQTVDPVVVGELVKRLRLLIEQPELRRRMGRAARWEVEHGRFSMSVHNSKLSRVFDEAIGGE